MINTTMKQTLARDMVDNMGTTGITVLQDRDGVDFEVKDFEKVEGPRYTNADQDGELVIYRHHADCNVRSDTGEWTVHHVLYQQGSELTAFCSPDEKNRNFKRVP